LGIVLVELFSDFGTAMERAAILGGLRRGILPDEWKAYHPDQAALAMRMVAKDPSERPSCHEILKELKPCLTKSTVQLEQALVDKDNTIKKLRDLLDSHQIPHGHI
jgi:hypothetical protein